jgi:excisionase family DNA binding protein
MRSHSDARQIDGGAGYSEAYGGTNTNRSVLEAYVSPEEAARFLKTSRLSVIRMARSGLVPAYPLRAGKRRQWRFKLSELDKHMQRELNSAHPPVRQRKGE